ncbi:MAG: PAS domain-containing protein [Candidatus Paceibacterota bacterium]
MRKNNKTTKKTVVPNGVDFMDKLWEKSWTYIKTVADVTRQPILILDKGLNVMAANESFYQTFQVESKDTEKKNVYELGNGQWDIPALRKLLENILPENTFFKGFEITHKFPHIGYKAMILNARQVYIEGDDTFPPIILLAIEDITDMMAIAEKLAIHTKQMEKKLTERTNKMEVLVKKLREEIDILKKGQKN